MTILEMINGAGNHEELKAAGTKLFKSKLSKEKRGELVKAYWAKRRELDREYVGASTNNILKQSLYHINTMTKGGAKAVASVGRTIYQISRAEGVLSKTDKDILFRAFAHQKRKIVAANTPEQAAA